MIIRDPFIGVTEPRQITDLFWLPGFLWVLDTQLGEATRVPGRLGAASAMGFNGDGSLLGLAMLDGTVLIYDADTNFVDFRANVAVFDFPQGTLTSTARSGGSRTCSLPTGARRTCTAARRIAALPTTPGAST